MKFLTLLCHFNHIFIKGTSKLVNSKFIDVLGLSIASRKEKIHLVNISCIMVTWDEVVLQTVDLPYIFLFFNIITVI